MERLSPGLRVELRCEGRGDQRAAVAKQFGVAAGITRFTTIWPGLQRDARWRTSTGGKVIRQFVVRDSQTKALAIYVGSVVQEQDAHWVRE